MSNKIPFDVELWKSGKYEAQDGNGSVVQSLLIHNVECTYPISVIFEGEGNETFTLNGKYSSDCDDTGSDLFLIPKKRKVWIAIKQDKIGNDKFHVTTQAYDTRKELINNHALNDWHIIEIELPE